MSACGHLNEAVRRRRRSKFCGVAGGMVCAGSIPTRGAPFRRTHLQGVLPRSSAHLKVGRAVLSAPWEVAKTRTFGTSAVARGAVRTPRPATDLFGQHALHTTTGSRAVLNPQQPPTRPDAQVDSTVPVPSKALRAEDGSRSVPFGRSTALVVLTGCAPFRIDPQLRVTPDLFASQLLGLFPVAATRAGQEAIVRGRERHKRQAKLPPPSQCGSGEGFLHTSISTVKAGYRVALLSRLTESGKPEQSQGRHASIVQGRGSTTLPDFGRSRLWRRHLYQSLARVSRWGA